MKLIFSRKGFDSALGKVPSPILPDGRMIQLPIPSRHSTIRYGDLQYDEFNLGDIVQDISNGRIAPADRAHVDPDLNKNSLEREPGWRPLFGQAGAAQGHLTNQGVGSGDIFLFFGWFQMAEMEGDRLKLNKKSKSIHALFGWLQIEKPISVHGPNSIPHWAAYHPHFQRPQPALNDTVYVSKPYLTLPQVGTTSFPGAGIFPHFSEKLQLTKDRCNRSIWQLPGWFYPREGQAPLTYHQKPDRWKREAGKVTLKTAGRGQEFVLDTSIYPESIDWLHALLR